MSDSCSDIYAAIARVEAKIAAIPRVDENSIINKAVDKSSGILKPEIAQIGVVAGGAAITAGRATNLADDALRLAGSALSRLGILAGELAGLVARFAGIISLVLNLVATVATYAILSSRIDSLERTVQVQQEIISAAHIKANSAVEKSNDAINKANAAIARADAASSQANVAIGKANAAIDSANGANNKADDAIESANNATLKAENANFKAEQAIGQANLATSKADNATGLANSAHRRLDEFDQGVRALHADFVTRLGLAVTYFEGVILGNLEEIHGIFDIHRNTIYNQLEPGLSRVEQKSTTALNIANQALTKANQVPRPSATNTNNLTASINAANTKADLALSTAVTASNTAQRALARPVGGVTIIPATGITRSEAELTRYINTTVTQAVGITAQQARAEQARQQPAISALQIQVAAIPATINAVNNRVTTVESQVREQAGVNQQGLAGIQQLTGLVQNLPTTLSSNPAFRNTIADLAEAGTCAAAAPDNCLGQPLGNLGDLLNSILNTGLPSLDTTLANILSQILARLNQLELNTGTTNGESFEAIRNQLNTLSSTVGVDEYPASLPASLISTDQPAAANVSITNLTQLFGWYIQRFDEIVGQFEIPIEIKDSDPATPGDQPTGFKLPNLAEAIAEMFLLIFQTNINCETLINISTRNLVEAGQDKQQNFVTYKLLQSLTDWVGFKQKDVKAEMPLLFTPGKTRFDELLKETKIKVSVPEFDEKFGLEADLMRFRKMASILDTAFFRKIDPNGDVKSQVMQNIRDLLGVAKSLNNDEDSFDDFLNDVENGFMNAPGVTNPSEPYGRPFNERPRVRDLTNYQPPQT